MRVAVDEIWVTPGSLVMRVIIWGENDAWRQKRYASVPLSEIPEEAMVALIGHYMDAQPEEDHHQTALF